MSSFWCALADDGKKVGSPEMKKEAEDIQLEAEQSWIYL